MSNINHDAHNVTAYTSGLTKALTGQRLVSVNWKTDKDTGIKRESKAVSIPFITAESVIPNLDTLMPHIIEFLQDTQNEMIRHNLETLPNYTLVTASDISMGAIASFLDSNGTSNRLTKEMIATWFEDNLADSISIALCDKLGISDTPSKAESDKVLAVVAAYKETISKLAGGKTQFKENESKAILNALSFASDDDVLANKFKTRIHKMMAESKVQKEDLLAALM